MSFECAVSKEFQLPLKEEESEDDDIPSAPTLDDFVVDNLDNKEIDESTSKTLEENKIEQINESTTLEEVENTDYEEDELLIEPWTSRFEPSAPISDFKGTSFIPVPEPVTQYPSLSSLRLVEESTHPAGTNSRFVTKPKAFTTEQLQQIYCCKELNSVRQFETYFIQHNLHFSYKDEPLFILLQAYSLFRGKLKLNLLDLKKLQANFKKTSENIWFTREATEKFEAFCNDNVLMQISESYE